MNNDTRQLRRQLHDLTTLLAEARARCAQHDVMPESKMLTMIDALETALECVKLKLKEGKK